MISDEKRLKVASALRGDTRDTLITQSRDGFEGMTYHEAAYRFWDMCRRVRSVADIDIAYSTKSVLADLIDRPTCHDVADFDRESFKCSRCGFRVLSIDGTPDAAKLVGTKGGVIDFGFCPNCGAVVVDEGGCDVPEL